MTVDQSLTRFGLNPKPNDLEEIRSILTAEISKEQRSQGGGCTLLMRLCCIQLFNSCDLDSVLLIWRAKSASMDAHSSIEVQLLCGAALEQTKGFLAGIDTEEAQAAYSEILDCEAAGDFEGFSVAEQSVIYYDYYSGE